MSDPIKEAEAMYNEVEVFEPSPGIHLTLSGPYAQALTAYEIKLRAALRSLIEHAKALEIRNDDLNNDLNQYESGDGYVARAVKAESERDAAVNELVEAIRLTVEYIGNDALPPIPGWSWFDALQEYAPDVAGLFVRNPIHLLKGENNPAPETPIQQISDGSNDA